MTFGRSAAAEYDVRFAVNTGQFRADMSTIGREYARTTGAMSSEALRAAVAQEKLDRAIKRSGPSSLAAKNATLAYRREMESLSSQTVRLGSNVRRTDHDLERFGRGALAGSGILRGFGRAASFASTSFLGGAGLLYAIKEATKAAQDHAVREGQLRTAVTAAGISYVAYRRQINEAIDAQERLGFSEEDSVKAFTKLIVATQDVAKATHYQGLAADIARKFNVDLAVAANAVARAVGGQTGALRRIDPAIKAGISSAQALKQAEHDLAGSAEDYGKRAAGAHDRATVAIHHEEVLIGQGLIPIRRRLDDEIATYLGKAENQKKIQEDVNQAIKAGTQIVHGLVDAERLIAPPIRIAIRALGGLEHAVTDALILGIVLKARRAAISFGLIQAASTRTAAVVVADAAVEEAAIAGVGTAAVVAGGKVALLGGRLVSLGKLGVAVAGLNLALNGNRFNKDDKWSLKGIGQALNPLNFGRDVEAALGMHDAREQPPIADSTFRVPGWGIPASANAGTGPKIPGTLSGTGQGLDRRVTPAQQRAIDLARNPDSLSALGAQRTYDQNAIAFLKRRFAAGKVDGKTYATTLASLYADQTSTDATIQSIHDAAAQTAADAASKAAASAKARAAKAARDYRTGLSTEAETLKNRILRQQAAQRGKVHVETTDAGRIVLHAPPARESRGEKNLIAFYRKEAHDARLTEGERQRYAHLALTEEEHAVKAIESETKRRAKLIEAAKKALAAKLAGQHELGDAILQNALAAAQLSETQAGSNAAAASKAQAAELRVEQVILAEQKRAGKNLVGLAQQQNLAEQLQTRSEIVRLKQQGGGKRADEFSVGDQILQNALETARLHETRAGTNAAKLKRAQADELRVYVAILKQQRAEEKGLTGLALQSKKAEEIATRSAIAQLKQSSTPAAAAAGANERQFLASFKQIVGAYAPNAFQPPQQKGGKTDTHLYELVHETRRQTGLVARLLDRTRFPASEYSGFSAGAAFG